MVSPMGERPRVAASLDPYLQMPAHDRRSVIWWWQGHPEGAAALRARTGVLRRDAWPALATRPGISGSLLLLIESPDPKRRRRAPRAVSAARRGPLRRRRARPARRHGRPSKRFS